MAPTSDVAFKLDAGAEDMISDRLVYERFGAAFIRYKASLFDATVLLVELQKRPQYTDRSNDNCNGLIYVVTWYIS